jgi:hypothetical protein
MCEELYSTGDADCKLVRPESFGKFCKVVVGFQSAKYATKVRANANRPKLGVVFDVFVESDKVGAAEILDDVIWHSSCIEYVKEGAEGGKVWVNGFFVKVREVLGG